MLLLKKGQIIVVQNNESSFGMNEQYVHSVYVVTEDYEGTNIGIVELARREFVQQISYVMNNRGYSDDNGSFSLNK